MTAAAPNVQTAERGAWAEVEGKWQRLFGDFFEEGVSIEWHDFKADADFDWGRSFHDDSLEVCLNFGGLGKIESREVSMGNVAIYVRGRREIGARRHTGARHQFVTVEFSREYLRRNLESAIEGLTRPVRDFIVSDKERPSGVTVRALTAVQQTLLTTMAQPPVPKAARPVWYQGKIFELISQTLFVEAEPALFCVKQKRLSRDRVECVKEILRQNVEVPPDLSEIARRVGCSAFYLSRLFSDEAGMTIPQFIRQLRMEKAAALLLSGKFNVTETALEVGYSSLSHFSRAFCETTGYCPALYATMAAGRRGGAQSSDKK